MYCEPTSRYRQHFLTVVTRLEGRFSFGGKWEVRKTHASEGKKLKRRVTSSRSMMTGRSNVGRLSRSYSSRVASSVEMMRSRSRAVGGWSGGSVAGRGKMRLKASGDLRSGSQVSRIYLP